ncbi:MAG TPA: hypothetical protein VHW23_03765 [Kofleriaceae bacterium]|jgi:hypothetical protein|nr:hypothetical protein [Kofleriaceae bacterium]
MKRFLLVLAAIAPLGAGGCNKPTSDECRQAITHMEELLGTEATARNADVEGEVRRCRGGSSKAAVTCAIGAKTPEDLKGCAFMGTRGDKKPAAPTPPAPAPGSAAPAAPAAPAPGTPPSGSGSN